MELTVKWVQLGKVLALVITALTLPGWNRVAGDPGPKILFVDPTAADGARIEDTPLEIQTSIRENHLTDVRFNWNGTDHVLYDDSLVLMFNFDNSAQLGENYVAGGLVKDISRAGNDGYLYSSPGVPRWVADGRYGGAFDFTGNGRDSGQSILVYHSESLNPGSGDFAIMIWIRTRNDSDGDVLRKGSTTTTTIPRMWYKLEHSPSSDNNRISLNFNTDGTDATINSTQAYNDDQWHFVVAQRRGDRAELWIDGAKDGSRSISGDISNTANLAVGSKDTQSDDFIDSALDEVRIYMRSFSEEEIRQLYYSNLSRYGGNRWTLYVNQSDLANGRYTYQSSASDEKRTNWTEQRAVTIVGQCPNLDGINPVVNLADFSILAYEWQGRGSGHESDLNQDEAVDIEDLITFVGYWLSDCQNE